MNSMEIKFHGVGWASRNDVKLRMMMKETRIESVKRTVRVKPSTRLGECWVRLDHVQSPRSGRQRFRFRIVYLSPAFAGLKLHGLIYPAFRYAFGFASCWALLFPSTRVDSTVVFTQLPIFIGARSLKH